MRDGVTDTASARAPAAVPAAAGGPVRWPRAPVRSWGRLTAEPHALARVDDRDAPLPPAEPGASMLPHGNGRSYGDACLNPGGGLWLMRGLDRFVAFDPATGILEAEAGVLLDDIVRVLLPRGWFVPVTPGTRFVTLGGAVACDVHGKNHHRAGTFGEHVLSLVLARSDGTRLACSRTQHADWLRATIGGLGLTGAIVSVRLQLMPVAGPWIDTETVPFGTLDEFFALSAASEGGSAYTVAWVDCVHGDARATPGVFFRGDHADDARPAPPPRERRVPLTPPVSLVNGASLRAFNRAYRLAQRLRAGRGVQPLLSFFYPLDALHGWNRLYGPRGFYQYQCVVPRAAEPDATRELLAAIRAAGEGSFLAVLKTFGDRPAAGLMSFPLAGTTLALDFPKREPATARLFARLDAVVAAAGGRVYLAKDACMPRALLRAGYPQLPAFARFRDPGVSSALARRLLDD